MAERTNISWCDHTWSPWYGCTQVSLGEKGACVNCYARELSEFRFHRVTFGGPGRGEGTRDVRADSAWSEPLRWNRQTPGAFVFPSLCDPFDNHPALREPRRRFFDLIRATPHLTWLLLTKRPQNIVKLYQEQQWDRVPAEQDTIPLASLTWPRNAAVGCTVVTQAEADRDIPHLLLAQAALRPAFTFLSMEPLMEAVDIAWALSPNRIEVGAGVLRRGHFDPSLEQPMRIGWCISGGETDQGKHKARETPDGAFESLMAQCAAAGVPFHLKQMTRKRPIPPHLQIQDRPVIAHG